MGMTPSAPIPPPRPSNPELPLPAVAVKVVRLFTQPPEVVFDAWVDARRMRMWIPPGDEVVAVESSKRVGGLFSIIARRKGVGVLDHHGEFLTVERPHKLAFSFLVNEMAARSSVVRLELQPESTGTRLTLVHEGVSPRIAEQMQQYWAGVTERIAATL